jgi:hypothetical protein
MVIRCLESEVYYSSGAIYKAILAKGAVDKRDYD